MQITLVDYRVNHNFECRFSPYTRKYTTANLKTQRVFVDYIIGTLFPDLQLCVFRNNFVKKSWQSTNENICKI